MNKKDESEVRERSDCSGEAESAGLAADSSRRARPGLSRSVQTQLGQRLRHFYEALALGEIPVPDRFIDIIKRMENLSAEKKPS